jgi:hypothetical protein
MASIKQRLPDLILVTTLFSPREEEELIALLRSLEGTEHLQTLTIPLLATDSDDDKPKRGLFRFGKKKKKALPETRGCDPAVFAEQINGYLKTAADLRANAEAQRAFASVHGTPAPAPAREPIAAPQAVASDEIIYDTVVREPVMSEPSVTDNSLYQSMFADQRFVEQAAPSAATTAETSPAYDSLYEPILADVKPSVFAEAAPDKSAPAEATMEKPFAEAAMNESTITEAAVDPPAAPRPPMFSFSAATLGELLERESKIQGGPLAKPRRASLTDLPRPSLRSLIDAELSRTSESSPLIDSPEPSHVAEPVQEPAQEQEPVPPVEPSPHFELASSVEAPAAAVEPTEVADAVLETPPLHEIERVFDSLSEPSIELDPEPEPIVEPVIFAAPPPALRLVQRLPPLAMWARIQMPEPVKPKAKESPASTPVDTHDVLHGLRVPAHVLLISYPQGCRIQRVRSV